MAVTVPKPKWKGRQKGGGKAGGRGRGKPNSQPAATKWLHDETDDERDVPLAVGKHAGPPAGVVDFLTPQATDRDDKAPDRKSKGKKRPRPEDQAAQQPSSVGAASSKHKLPASPPHQPQAKSTVTKTRNTAKPTPQLKPRSQQDVSHHSSASQNPKAITPGASKPSRLPKAVPSTATSPPANEGSEATPTQAAADHSGPQPVHGQESSGSEEDSHSEEEGDVDSDGADEGQAETGGATGMGDVMARILAAKVDSEMPVLAKRKTKAMREMEEHAALQALQRSKSHAKRTKLTQQMVVPDFTTLDYERQLKKIATRGVVALFNAISKAQQPDEEEPQPGGARPTGRAVKEVSKSAFLDMLKSNKPGAAARKAVSAPARPALAEDSDDDSDGGAPKGKAWSVLNEDYMMGASTMKEWDEEGEASSGGEDDGQLDDMSDSDSG